jgi:AcrR family transcriptional regulator
MPRSGKDVRRRLQLAALELYRERGYDRTTAAEIAARAGVTERTFFRHFPDKREVLFDGGAELLEALGAAVVAAPAELAPMEVLLRTFGSIEQLLEDGRAFSQAAHQVIVVTPALQERQLAKSAAMIAILTSALQQRGVEANLAMLAASTGIAVFGHAARAWHEDPSVSLGVHLERAFLALDGLSAAAASPASSQSRPRHARKPAAL